MKLLRMILADAVIERLIAYNPIQPRRRGRTRTVRPTERIWATPDEVLRIADQAAGYYHPCGAILIITAAWTGARWGELTGLHRRNLHLDGHVMIVDPHIGALHEAGAGKQWLGPPKNAGSARTITLPEFSGPPARATPSLNTVRLCVHHTRRALAPSQQLLPPSISARPRTARLMRIRKQVPSSDGPEPVDAPRQSSLA